MVESTTDEVAGFKKEQMDGRLKRVPDGKKVPKHAHIAIVGSENKSAYTYAKTVKNSMEKRFGQGKAKLVSKRNDMEANSDHAVNYINYCLRQADHYRTGGDFDFFKYMRDPEETTQSKFGSNPLYP